MSSAAAPLIPREILFGNPDRLSPKLSPRGEHLAYLAPDDRNVMQVWLQTEDGEPDRPLTADAKRGIRFFVWAYDGDHILYIQDSDGDENWHVHAVHIYNGGDRDLTPFEQVQARIIGRDPFFPDQLLVAMNRDEPTRMDVYRLNLTSGEMTRDTLNPGSVVDWLVDAQFQVRAAISSTPDGGYDLIYRSAPDQAWVLVRHWDAENNGGVVEFSADGKTLYIEGTHHANAMRLIAIDVDTFTETVLAEDDQYDVGGVMIHPTQRTIQAAAFYRDRLEWQVLDPAIADDLTAIAQVRSGEYTIVSRTLDDRVWLVAYDTDDGPTYYYRYDRPQRLSTLLFSNQPKLETLPLVPMQSIAYTARDGLTIHGYLSLPSGLTPRSLPTVLLVHGGPWARDTWGYQGTVQWLANRGYAVLQVNFRGSTGYGKAFLNAGNREWAAKMHDDLIDAVDWLVAEGIADRHRVAIMGGSYGGYATLVGLTFTPEVFAAGVDIVGPSNIVTLLNTIPPYWKPMRAMFDQRVGNVESEVKFLESRSPLFYVDRIQKPLLIGQGANDPRVKKAESEQIVQAMQSAGKPVEYIVYADEGHGFARPENRLHFYAHVEAFLAKHLGGQLEDWSECPGHTGVVDPAAASA